MMEMGKCLFAIHIHLGEIQPFNQMPEKARGHGGIPERWEE